MAAPQPANRARLSTSAIARLLTSDMREELLAIIREMFERNPSAERLGISKEPVHDQGAAGSSAHAAGPARTRAGPGRGLPHLSATTRQRWKQEMGLITEGLPEI